MLANHELGRLLDEEMTEEEKLELERAEKVCRSFLAWNLEAEKETGEADVKRMLRKITGRFSDADGDL